MSAYEESEDGQRPGGGIGTIARGLVLLCLAVGLVIAVLGEFSLGAPKLVIAGGVLALISGGVYAILRAID